MAGETRIGWGTAWVGGKKTQSEMVESLSLAHREGIGRKKLQIRRKENAKTQRQEEEREKK